MNPAQRTESGGNVGAYNNFWMDRGTNIVGDRRTSLIVDPPNGRIPTVTEAGRERRAAGRGSFSDNLAASHVNLSNADRCIMGFNAGPPITPGGYNQNMQLSSDPRPRRTADRDGAHRAGCATRRTSRARGWSRPMVRRLAGALGRGHPGGPDANFDGKRGWRGSSTGMRLVERFTRVDADTLEYEYTVTDPETWTAPWTVRLPMRRNELPLFEYACHEGNYAMEAMLAGARADERKAEQGGQ